MELAGWSNSGQVTCGDEEDAISQDIFESLELSHEASSFPLNDQTNPLCHEPSDNAANEISDLLRLASNLCEASNTESELVNGRQDTKMSKDTNEELDIVGLMERCEGDVELAIAVLSAFCSQGAEHCSALQKVLNEGKHDEMYLRAVCESTLCFSRIRCEAFYHIISRRGNLRKLYFVEHHGSGKKVQCRLWQMGHPWME
jgi:hypothetical protein